MYYNNNTQKDYDEYLKMKKITENVKTIQQEILNANSKLEDILNNLNDSVCEEQNADDIVYDSSLRTLIIYKKVSQVFFKQNIDSDSLDISIVYKLGAEKDVSNISDLNIFKNTERLLEQVNMIINIEKDLFDLSHFTNL